MTVILVKMYNGGYLEHGNLGHEIINLFRADNGKCYVYLPYDGILPPSRKDEDYCMIFVRTVEGKNKSEILGYATGLKDIFSENNNGATQRQYIHNNNIKYGGVWLDELFCENKSYQDICITFEAEKVYLPAAKLYISNKTEGNDIIKLEAKLAKTSLRQYFPIDTEDGKILYSLITDPNNQGKDIEKVDRDHLSGSDPQLTFFDICGINDYELAWSNALAWLITRYPELLSAFAQKVLEKSDFTIQGKINVIRESKNNIDLWIEDDTHIIVVENKIKSDVNGVVFTRHHNKNNRDEYSQLKKYYEYAINNKSKKTVSFFVLTPDYNKIELFKYAEGDKYTNIFYSQICDFLEKQHIDDFYIKELVNAMKQHTQEHYHDLYEEMKRKFIRIIEKYCQHQAK